jgi:cytochrome c-type biogenesis protein CcmH
MMFLLIAGVLLLIALLIVLPPLWRIPPNPPFSKGGKKGLGKGGKKDQHPPLAKGGRGGFAADQDQRNIAIARQRLAELKEQLQAGALTQTLYDEQLAELEQALSDDLDIVSHVRVEGFAGAEALPSQGRWMAWVLVLVIPLMAGSLYWTLGNHQSLMAGDQAVASQTMPEREQINKMVAGLAERLQKQPDDAQGWTMLGRSYKFLQQNDKAVAAFEHAYKLIGDQVEIMLLYADALAFNNDEQMVGKPSELVFKALAIEPENVTALWLGGLAKAQAGEFVAAMNLWKKLQAVLPQGSESQKEVQDMMAKLATQMPEGTVQEQVKPAQTAQTTQTTQTVAVDVQVSLDPELQKSTSPTDTVFIYAQAVSGPKMPLAIVRKQVSELPLTVSLTDAMAMTPAMKLSSFQQVKLLARISKSGTAMQQPGDLIGVIDQIALTDKSLHKILINSSIK